MLGIFWAKGLEPSAAPGVLAAPRLFPLPLEWALLSGLETCLARSGCRTHYSCGRGNSDRETDQPYVYFSLMWTVGWMGSDIGWRGQNLLLILVPWGSQRGRGVGGLNLASVPPGIPAHLL